MVGLVVGLVARVGWDIAAVVGAVGWTVGVAGVLVVASWVGVVARAVDSDGSTNGGASNANGNQGEDGEDNLLGGVSIGSLLVSWFCSSCCFDLREGQWSMTLTIDLFILR